MIRAFAALDLPPSVKQTLCELQSGIPGARWIDPAGFHVTLRFLGETAEDVLEDVHHAFEAVDAPAFDLEIRGVGSFGQGARTRMLWAGVGASEPLAHLQRKVESAAVRAGLPAETRRFTPHVTLARLDASARASEERVRRFLEANAVFRAGPVRIDRFVLFESRLGHGGATYAPLGEYPLRS
jgi:2'-5' RNA ligase